MKPTAIKRKTVKKTSEENGKKTILILVNKGFEFTGFEDGYNKVLGGIAFSNITLCCIENELFGKGNSEEDREKDRKLSSNSEEKHKRLLKYLQSEWQNPAPDYIFSVSTSESTYEGQGGATRDEKDKDGKHPPTANGCVYVGGRFFLADCREINKGKDHYGKSKLEVCSPATGDTQYYKLTQGTINLLGILSHKDLINSINGSLLKVKRVPSFPKVPAQYYCSTDYCCVGVVNVTNYAQYPIADGYAYGRFYTETAERYGNPICIETTHGVVRMVAEKVYKGNVPPVIFVSPITDRFVRFDKDVTRTKDKEKFDNQNYACSYNSGVAVAHMMKFLDDPKSNK